MKEYTESYTINEILQHGPPAIAGPLGLRAIYKRYRILRHRVTLICISRASKLVEWRYHKTESHPLTSQIELVMGIYEALYGIQTEKDNKLISQLTHSITQCLVSALHYDHHTGHPEYRPLRRSSAVRRWHDHLQDIGYMRFEDIKCEEWMKAD